MKQVHATCVDWNGYGILISGASGSGKSDLALRLIEQGAVLVADDRTVLENDNGDLIASAPENLRGLMELRGIGIVETPFSEKTTVRLKIDLHQRSEIDRMPETTTERIENVTVPSFKLDAFDQSVVAKIRWLLMIASNERKLIS